jgi:repressor lexA
MIKLTNKQKRIYEFIVNYIKENSYPPSVRDICAGLGLKSPATVHTHIQNLADLGVLKKSSLKKRAIAINEDFEYEEEVQSLYKKDSSQTETREVTNEGIDYFNVPVLGNVAAGTPILAVENVERTFPLPMDFAKSNKVFMLKVKGESMINVGINDGDYVIVEQRQTAVNGEIVVALMEDSATVKTFYKEKGYFRLQPENDSMEPIIVNEVSILGKVVGLFRMM